jgi:hypothetical protein
MKGKEGHGKAKQRRNRQGWAMKPKEWLGKARSF